MIFGKSELTSVIRNVEATTRKVGFMLTILKHRIHLSLSLTDRNAGDVWE